MEYLLFFYFLLSLFQEYLLSEQGTMNSRATPCSYKYREIHYMHKKKQENSSQLFRFPVVSFGLSIS